jgi:hypothetical protein
VYHVCLRLCYLCPCSFFFFLSILCWFYLLCRTLYRWCSLRVLFLYHAFCCYFLSIISLVFHSQFDFLVCDYCYLFFCYVKIIAQHNNTIHTTTLIISHMYLYQTIRRKLYRGPFLPIQLESPHVSTLPPPCFPATSGCNVFAPQLSLFFLLWKERELLY